MRLIDADALKEQTAKRNSIWDSVSDIYGRGLTKIIDSMPTVDAVEVIRCKDCKFFVSDMEWCEADDEHPAEPDAFCSWAERREDED